MNMFVTIFRPKSRLRTQYCAAFLRLPQCLNPTLLEIPEIVFPDWNGTRHPSSYSCSVKKPFLFVLSSVCEIDSRLVSNSTARRCEITGPIVLMVNGLWSPSQSQSQWCAAEIQESVGILLAGWGGRHHHDVTAQARDHTLIGILQESQVRAGMRRDSELLCWELAG